MLFYLMVVYSFLLLHSTIYKQTTIYSNANGNFWNFLVHISIMNIILCIFWLKNIHNLVRYIPSSGNTGSYAIQILLIHAKVVTQIYTLLAMLWAFWFFHLSPIFSIIICYTGLSGGLKDISMELVSTSSYSKRCHLEFWEEDLSGLSRWTLNGIICILWIKSQRRGGLR